MSVNYRQTTVSGDSWVRTRRIVVENEYGVSPVVKFIEEQKINLEDGSQVNRDLGTLKVETNEETMDTVIRIVNPVTGKYTGKDMTYAELYAAVHSAYLTFAALRDNPKEDYDPTVGGTDEEDYAAEDENQYLDEEQYIQG